MVIQLQEKKSIFRIENLKGLVKHLIEKKNSIHEPTPDELSLGDPPLDKLWPSEVSFLNSDLNDEEISEYAEKIQTLFEDIRQVDLNILVAIAYGFEEETRESEPKDEYRLTEEEIEKIREIEDERINKRKLDLKMSVLRKLEKLPENKKSQINILNKGRTEKQFLEALQNKDSIRIKIQDLKDSKKEKYVTELKTSKTEEDIFKIIDCYKNEIQIEDNQKFEIEKSKQQKYKTILYEKIEYMRV